MIETPFPLEVSSWNSTVMFKTTITVGANGQESRNAEWQDPLHRFNAALGVRTKADLVALKSFFWTVRGRETAFLVKDYVDYRIDVNGNNGGFQSIGVDFQPTDGTRTEFQIFAVYENALSQYIVRHITRPINNAYFDLTHTLESEPQAVSYVVDYTTGIITFGEAPSIGAVIQVKCEFYVPCRFDTDELPLDLLSYWIDSGGLEKGVYQVPEVPLIEVRI
jgi:uncharacterized protein (TIGR02217 family)